MAVEFVEKLANNPNFAYRHRLKTCIPAKPTDAIGLQLADLMAYEYFRNLRDKPVKKRFPMSRIRDSSNYAEGYFGEDTFMKMKSGIEGAPCGPDDLVIIPTL